ncbi:hypothetical protein [Micromonospora parathelypteridis]|uniref:Type IV secretory pathway TrbL component n=1 Tax=Micromonospora parathelypteridis TaxID=1839617 RepID=A0A840VY37_9ACTN|nr:hypothetical protein [Micromonospora parathelypteridis]MBB5477029.1 type IV secretory pathway TrbL component [Micromonospora parathelypteridis]GGO18174.1 hypothetical protein GCM10011576_32900 [Micromonospora parathelypteridis]
MRRLLAVTALVTVLFGAAGCSADRSGVGPGPTGVTAEGSGTTPPGVTAMPASGGAAGGTTQICAAAQQASTTALRTYVAEVGQMIAAVGAGDSSTAEAARRRAEAALAAWRTQLREQSEQATDPQLKTLLTDLGTEVAALGADVESIDETELDRLQQRLDQLCAR